ncbi:MAG: endonuclease/exonuclease/phosphatase family protein [Marmoricola sp.]
MVFAREPLERVQKLNVTNGAWSMRLGGGEKGITLVGVHTTPPLYGIKLWRQDLREVAASVSQAKADGDTVLVAGDFNATIDHRAFREVLDAGLIDAADACGESHFGSRRGPGPERNTCQRGRQAPCCRLTTSW